MKDVHLGELIFGASKWASYGLPPTKSNPLTEMFAHEGNLHSIVSVFYAFYLTLGLLDEPTYLYMDIYDKLFVPYTPQTWSRRHTYTYRIPKKQVWCITPKFPLNSLASPTVKTRYILVFRRCSNV